MVSDKKRREVARKLRANLKYMLRNERWYARDLNPEGCGNMAYRAIAASVKHLGHCIAGNYIHIVELVADLIDRPTCEAIEHGRPDESHVCKSCSRCSYGWFECIHDKPYSYCPNCGAVVTDKEEDDD